MKYPYAVKYNGEYYKAGENIPEAGKKMAVDEIPLPFPDEDITFEEKPEKKKYTKTEINRMSKAELREFATNLGIAGAHEISGAELKTKLISMPGL